MNQILTEVLSVIKPNKTEEKEILTKIDEIIKKIQASLPKTKVILGGSGKKGTWLKKAHDADIFVQFPKETKDISNILEKQLTKLFKIKRIHGSRDYFQTKINNFTYEIVPIIKITNADQAENITDISPLHAKYVLKNKSYQDEIRLTKQFFKAARVYGAESYINGFSGYICEILTIHYKGFENLVKSIAKWKPKTIVDPKSYHTNPLFDLDKAKTIGPLVIVDPVQKSRNAAAAVSIEKYKRLIDYTKKYLKSPSTNFFEIKSIDKKHLKTKAKKNHFIELIITPLGGKEDVIGCKIVKAFDHIKQELTKNDFSIIHSDWEWEKNATLYLIIKNETLDAIKIIKGPPIKIKHHAEKFTKAHKNTYQEKGYLFAKEKRIYVTSNKLIQNLLKDKYINERVKSIELR